MVGAVVITIWTLSLVLFDAIQRKCLGATGHFIHAWVVYRLSQVLQCEIAYPRQLVPAGRAVLHTQPADGANVVACGTLRNGWCHVFQTYGALQFSQD